MRDYMLLNTPRWIVCHHTGGMKSDFYADTSHHTPAIVNTEHKRRRFWKSTLGWYVGEHYFIESNGNLTQTRNDTDEGCHCIGRNTDSIGICLAGNFSSLLPTKQQETALKALLSRLVEKYDIPLTQIVPHRRFAYKDCYGKKLSDNWARMLLAEKPADKENLKQQISIIQQLIKIYTLLLKLLKLGGKEGV